MPFNQNSLPALSPSESSSDDCPMKEVSRERISKDSPPHSPPGTAAEIT